MAHLEQQITGLEESLRESVERAGVAVAIAEMNVEQERKLREQAEKELQQERSVTTLLTIERDTLSLIVARQKEIRRADLMDAQLEVMLRTHGSPIKGKDAIRPDE